MNRDSLKALLVVILIALIILTIPILLTLHGWEMLQVLITAYLFTGWATCGVAGASMISEKRHINSYGFMLVAIGGPILLLIGWKMKPR